jgi:hypothetical protein
MPHNIEQQIDDMVLKQIDLPIYKTIRDVPLATVNPVRTAMRQRARSRSRCQARDLRLNPTVNPQTALRAFI